MNRYKAISETEFIKFPSQELTEQEIQILNSRDNEAIVALKEELKTRLEPIKLEGAELAEVETVYYAYKPQLEEGDDYTLISFEVVLDNGVEGSIIGAYNYKLNKQIFNVILK